MKFHLLRKMPQSLCNLPTRTKPPKTLLKSEDFVFSSVPTTQSMHKSTALTIDNMKEMAEFATVEIATEAQLLPSIFKKLSTLARLNRIPKTSHRGTSPRLQMLVPQLAQILEPQLCP